MRAVFLGSKALGLDVARILRSAAGHLDWAILHPDDRRDARSALAEFSHWAEAEHLPFHLVGSRAEARECLTALRPEIAFVCGWYWLLDADILALAPKGFFGLHNSLLPRYRGGAPLVWSILEGEPWVGGTVFRLTPGMDDGDILLQVKVANTPEDDVASLLDKILAELAKALTPAWAELVEGRAVLTPQNQSEATIVPQRKPEDGRIDWTQPAARLHDFIRAQAPPYPGAFAEWNGRRVHVLKTQPISAPTQAPPGHIIAMDSDGVLIGCGGGTVLRLLRLTVAGNPITGADLVAIATE